MGLHHFEGVQCYPHTMCPIAVCNFVSYAYACRFKSSLGHCAYETFGKSLHLVVLCPISPTSEDACP